MNSLGSASVASHRARGNAFAATADNPSAIYYNPAGITQLEGQNLSLGSYFISTDVHYESFTGKSASTKTGFQAVPQIYYTFSPKDSPFSGSSRLLVGRFLVA